MNPTDSQRECIEKAFGIPSAVSAGAGSGKTATLTSRIVYALEHPGISGVDDIDKVLIITYTNKAANELKSRIKAALEAAGMGEQALKVDGAWISTIHGMCSRILKENAFTFGVDPSYDILSDEVRAKLLDDAIEQVLTSPSDLFDETGMADVLHEFGRGQVKDMIARLIDLSAESTDPLRDHFILPVDADPFECLFELVRLSFEFAERCDGAGKVAQRYCDGFRGAMRRIVNSSDGVSMDEFQLWFNELAKDDAGEALDIAAQLPKPSGNFGKVASEPLGGKDEKPIASIFRCATDLRLSVQRARLEALIDIAQQVKDLFSEMKRQLGVMDNNDLIATAAHALSDPRNSAIKQRYNEQFGLVMVDEFQDTNQVQVDMINLIAGGSRDRISEKMCVVGDAQQSIYRFRNADLEVFRSHLRQIEDPRGGGVRGKVISFQENFRSHGEILAFTKEVFQRTFDQGTYLELLHGRDEGRAEARKPFLGAQGAPKDDESDVARRVNLCVFADAGAKGVKRHAARAIAHDFAKLVERGHKPGDMAILLGSMGNAAAYAQALEDVGLRCAITGGSVFKDTAEAKVVVSLSYALANPRHTNALADVLTSDLFCLNAEDLLFLVTAGPVARTRKQALSDLFDDLASGLVSFDDLASRGMSVAVECALRVLGEAMRQVGRRPLSRIVEDVVVNSGWASRNNGHDTVRAGNLFKAIRMLSDIERTEHIDALALARHLDVRVNELKEPPGVLSATGDDFVRIMTIHASKGLQFPIVAVSEAAYSASDKRKLKSISLDGKTYLALEPGASIDAYADTTLIKLNSSQRSKLTDGFEAGDYTRMITSPKCPSDSLCGIKGADDIAQRYEHQRKLYVAYTRAEEALIVAFKPPSSRQVVPVADALSAIQDLVCGDGQPYRVEPGASQTSFVEVHTAYTGHEEKDLDWTMRLTVHSLSDVAQDDQGEPCEEAALADGAVFASAGSEHGGTAPGRSRMIPTRPVGLEVPSVRYRSSWARGILSASSIKSASGHDLGAPAARDAVLLDDDEEPPASAADRGTAFHSLCEWSASRRADHGSFVPVPPERVCAIARTYGLNAKQRAELEEAFERWISCDAAQRACAHRVVEPEAPFYVELSEAHGAREPMMLEGFIDLLAYDEFGKGSAYVVDYKTGTSLTQDAQRRDAYEIQAMTYAYALLLQGFEEVRLDFVFVDQLDPEDGDRASITTFPKPQDAPYVLDELRADLIAAIGQL